MVKRICLLGWLLGAGLFFYSLMTYLNGPHQMRQAATAFVGYFYFKEQTPFLYPKIAARGLEAGVAINEFPIYGYVVGTVARLKGGWDEATPRIVSLAFAIGAGLLFFQVLRRKFPEFRFSRIEFLTLFLLIPVHFAFFTIPMPDSAALFFCAGAAALWSRPKATLTAQIAAAVSFGIGFLIRPYYILFLFFFSPSLIVSGLVLAMCCVLFYLWFRVWNSIATTNHGYFGIQFQTTEQILAALPKALKSLPSRLIEHTSLVGIWLLYRIGRRNSKLLLWYLAPVAMMIALKSTHIAVHPYYMINASVFAVFLLALGLDGLSERKRAVFFALFLVHTFASTQHFFRANDDLPMIEEALKASGPIPEDAVMAAYTDGYSQWLYYIKRTGYELPMNSFDGKCPKGATHYLIQQKIEGAKRPRIVIDRCPN